MKLNSPTVYKFLGWPKTVNLVIETEFYSLINLNEIEMIGVVYSTKNVP